MLSKSVPQAIHLRIEIVSGFKPTTFPSPSRSLSCRKDALRWEESVSKVRSIFRNDSSKDIEPYLSMMENGKSIKEVENSIVIDEAEKTFKKYFGGNFKMKSYHLDIALKEWGTSRSLPHVRNKIKGYFLGILTTILH